MKQTMELSYNKELWRLEPSEDRQMCLFTNSKTGEVYPLVHRNRRSITKIRQMNKTDFEYLTIEHDGKAEVRPWYYQIRLSKGKVSYLACQYVPFYMKGLYFKPRAILIRKILEVNNLAEAKPKFKKLEMEGCFEYDKRSYEIIQSPEYFIVKTKKDGDVHAVYMGMEPIGLKQVSKTVFLNLYKVGKRYLLKRFQTCAEHSFYDGIGGGAIQFAERELWLDSLDCVVADEVIYGDKGLGVSNVVAVLLVGGQNGLFICVVELVDIVLLTNEIFRSVSRVYDSCCVNVIKDEAHGDSHCHYEHSRNDNGDLEALHRSHTLLFSC